jgi:hypothetical protein
LFWLVQNPFHDRRDVPAFRKYYLKWEEERPRIIIGWHKGAKYSVGPDKPQVYMGNFMEDEWFIWDSGFDPG